MASLATLHIHWPCHMRCTPRTLDGPFPTHSALGRCQGHVPLVTWSGSAAPRGPIREPTLGAGPAGLVASLAVARGTTPITTLAHTCPCPCPCPLRNLSSAHYPCLNPCPCPCTSTDMEGGREAGRQGGLQPTLAPFPMQGLWGGCISSSSWLQQLLWLQ